MPFDVATASTLPNPNLPSPGLPSPGLPSPGLPRSDVRSARLVAIWLFGMCAMLWVMVTLGGATRLTGSGLSIMEWAPLRGTLPPLSEAEWNRLYDLYRQVPQYELVNKGFGLEGFKQIFWLEWGHRFWGRLIGLAFLAPLLWFAVRGHIGRRLGMRLGVLFLLGGLQGAIGWFMVASGFAANSTTVLPYRLVIHLSLALALYSAILWTALDLWRGSPPAGGTRGLRRLAQVTLGFLAATVVAGGFVAGLRAGLTYNSFPFMDGRLVPEGYASMRPIWLNFMEDIATVQFNHRLLATLTATLALVTVAWGLTLRVSPAARLALWAMGAAVAGQYALGVATLLWVVPVSLGTAHQGMAVVVLTAALVLVHTLRRAPEAALR